MIIVLNFQAPQNTGVNTGVTAASSTSISAASTVRFKINHKTFRSAINPFFINRLIRRKFDSHFKAMANVNTI